MLLVNKQGLGAFDPLGMQGAVSLDADALAFIARITTPPTDLRKSQINSVFVALKAAGVLTKLDALYVFAAADAQASLLNWASTSFNATNVSATSFTADVGYTGDGVADYIDTNYNLSTSGGQLVRDSASIFAWSNTAAVNDTHIMGNNTAAAVNMQVRPRGTGDLCQINVSSASTLSKANADGLGLFAGNRTSSTAVESFRNGSSLGTGSVTSAALESTTMCFLRRSATFSTHQVLCGGFGTVLTTQNHADLYTALHTYLQAVAGIA